MVELNGLSDVVDETAEFEATEPAAAAAGAAAGAEARGRCPGCSTGLEWVGADRGAVCVSCGWRGRLWAFDPVPLVVETAKQALPEDATCAHHPAKRAEAVCGGTGDYICSLCAVKSGEEVYSAAYLERGGKEVAGKKFEKKLDRPDSAVVLFILLCFLPPLNYLWVLASPIWVPWGYVKLVKASRMRREDPLAERVIGTTRLFVLGALLTVVLTVIVWLGVAIVGEPL